MDKRTTLRDYQTNILARLENAKKAGAEPPAGYLGVVIGSKNVLINLQEISETLPMMTIQRVPLVKPWFLGVANVRGVLYAINDLGQLIDNTHTAISSNARLVMVSESVTSNVAFVVDKMIGLRKLDEMTISKQAVEESVCLKTQTYEDADRQTWHMLDCDKLVRSKEFVTPYEI
ncbi:MAG: chemotaxis protein CheW [Bdellovibrio sp.]|nr:chemotaxis protein CheW [Methylotenera sp.]